MLHFNILMPQPTQIVFILALKKELMKVSDNAKKLRLLIDKAMEDHKISREEYENIIHLALEDANVDIQERALIRELQDMIDNRQIKLVP